MKDLSDIEDNPEWEKMLKEIASEAGREAVRQLLEEGIPVTLKDGNEIIKLHPDGRREIVCTWRKDPPLGS